MSASLPLEKFAAINAELDARKRPQAEVLRDAGVTEEAWAKTVDFWLGRMAQEAKRNRFVLSQRYATLFAERRLAADETRKAPKVPRAESLPSHARGQIMAPIPMAHDMAPPMTAAPWSAPPAAPAVAAPATAPPPPVMSNGSTFGPYAQVMAAAVMPPAAAAAAAAMQAHYAQNNYPPAPARPSAPPPALPQAPTFAPFAPPPASFARPEAPTFAPYAPAPGAPPPPPQSPTFAPYAPQPGGQPPPPRAPTFAPYAPAPGAPPPPPQSPTFAPFAPPPASSFAAPSAPTFAPFAPPPTSFGASAARYVARLSLDQLAAMRAEIAVTAEDAHGAIKQRFGLDDATWFEEEAHWQRRLGGDKSLFQTYVKRFQYFRALLAPRA